MSYIDLTPTNYKQSLETFKDELRNNETNLNIVIEALKKSYVEYKLYPNVSELENIHNNNLYNLSDVSQKNFLLDTNIKQSNESLKTIIYTKNEELETLKVDNKKLTQKYKSMTDSDQSSIGLQSQYKDEYTQKYLSLVLLMSFTLLATFMSGKFLNSLRHIMIPK